MTKYTVVTWCEDENDKNGAKEFSTPEQADAYCLGFCNGADKYGSGSVGWDIYDADGNRIAGTDND